MSKFIEIDFFHLSTFSSSTKTLIFFYFSIPFLSFVLTLLHPSNQMDPKSL